MTRSWLLLSPRLCVSARCEAMARVGSEGRGFACGIHKIDYPLALVLDDWIQVIAAATAAKQAVRKKTQPNAVWGVGRWPSLHHHIDDISQRSHHRSFPSLPALCGDRFERRQGQLHQRRQRAVHLKDLTQHFNLLIRKQISPPPPRGNLKAPRGSVTAPAATTSSAPLGGSESATPRIPVQHQPTNPSDGLAFA